MTRGYFISPQGELIQVKTTHIAAVIADPMRIGRACTILRASRTNGLHPSLVARAWPTEFVSVLHVGGSVIWGGRMGELAVLELA